jgi:shikimate kinase
MKQLLNVRWRFLTGTIAIGHMLPVFIAVCFLTVFLIALCSRADDRKRERKEGKEKSESSSEKPVYDDRLQDYSDNANFHINAKSNKELRAERAAAAARAHDSDSV